MIMQIEMNVKQEISVMMRMLTVLTLMAAIPVPVMMGMKAMAFGAEVSITISLITLHIMYLILQI